MHLGFFGCNDSAGHASEHGSGSESDGGTSSGGFHGHVRILG
jgi:hypothetical protein